MYFHLCLYYFLADIALSAGRRVLGQTELKEILFELYINLFLFFYCLIILFLIEPDVLFVGVSLNRDRPRDINWRHHPDLGYIADQLY